MRLCSAVGPKTSGYLTHFMEYLFVDSKLSMTTHIKMYADDVYQDSLISR